MQKTTYRPQSVFRSEDCQDAGRMLIPVSELERFLGNVVEYSARD